MAKFTPIIEDIVIPRWHGERLDEGKSSLLKVEIEVSDGNPGTTIFSFCVVNRSWINEHKCEHNAVNSPHWINDRGILFMQHLSIDEIHQIVEKIISGNQPYESFREFSEKTRQYFFWEMDGMPLPNEIQ